MRGGSSHVARIGLLPVPPPHQQPTRRWGRRARRRCGRIVPMIRTPLTTLVFALGFSLILLAGTAMPTESQSGSGTSERYLSPIELSLSPDGRLLYVVCEANDELRVVDIGSGKVVNAVHVGHVPRGITLSPDGNRIYVTNSWSD